MPKSRRANFRSKKRGKKMGGKRMGKKTRKVRRKIYRGGINKAAGNITDAWWDDYCQHYDGLLKEYNTEYEYLKSKNKGDFSDKYRKKYINLIDNLTSLDSQHNNKICVENPDQYSLYADDIVPIRPCRKNTEIPNTNHRHCFSSELQRL